MRSPPPLLLAAAGVLSGCLLDALIKAMTAEVSVLTVTSWRFIFGSLYAAAIFFALGRALPGWESLRFHAMRGTIQVIAALTFFYGLTQLGLAEATVIGFTAALMIAPVARLILGERFSRLSVLAAIIGFTGAAIAMSGETSGGPEDASRLLGIVSTLTAAFAYAVAIVLLRLRTQSEDAMTIVLLSNLMPALILAPFLLATDPVPALSHMPVYMLLGVFGLGIWWLFTLAYARAPAQRLAPLEYTALIWSAVLGFVFFGEVPAWQLYLGAAVIIAACLVVAFESHFATRREARLPASDVAE